MGTMQSGNGREKGKERGQGIRLRGNSAGCFENLADHEKIENADVSVRNNCLNTGYVVLRNVLRGC